MSAMLDPSPPQKTWRKSSYSNGTGGECVEVAVSLGATAIRDSKDPNGPALAFPRETWAVFIVSVGQGKLGQLQE